MKDIFGREISIAPSDEISKYGEHLDYLLWAIAPYMGWSDIDNVFVTDMSRIGDFCLGEDEIEDIANEIGINLTQSSLLYEVARDMANKGQA